MDTSNTASTASSRSILRYVIGVLATLLLLSAMAAGISDSSATGQPTETDRPTALFGCAGTMVISNVDCEMGVATAFDLDLSNGLAPWCDGQLDMTVYGCFDSSDMPNRSAVQVKQARRVQCHRDVPTLHADGVVRAFENPCAGDVWVDEVLVVLAANNVQTQGCLALTNPGPACIP